MTSLSVATFSTVLALCFCSLTDVALGQRDEPNRDTLHPSAVSGFTGSPTGFSYVQSRGHYQVFYQHSEDYFGQSTMPRSWKTMATPNAYNRWSDPQVFLQGTNSISFLGGSTIPNILGYPHTALVTTRAYYNQQMSVQVEARSVEVAGNAGSPHSQFSVRGVIDPGLFVYQNRAYFIAVDTTSNSQGQQSKCQFRVVELSGPSLHINNQQLNCPVSMPGFQGVCRSPAVIEVGGKWFVVSSVRAVGGNLYRAEYIPISLSPVANCLIMTGTNSYVFDAGFDAMDFKFARGNNSVLAIGWQGNEYTTVQFPRNNDWRYGLTTVREVSEKNGRLTQRLLPSLIDDLGSCCGGVAIVSYDYELKAPAANVAVKDSCTVKFNFKEKVCPKENGAAFLFDLHFNFKDHLAGSAVVLSFYNDDNQFVSVTFNKGLTASLSDMQIVVDRSHARNSPNDVTPSTYKVSDNVVIDGHVRILLDRGSLEVYSQGGQFVLSNIFRNSGADFHTFCAASMVGSGKDKKNKLLKMSTVRKLRSIYTGNHQCNAVRPSSTVQVGFKVGFLLSVAGSLLIIA